VGRRRVHQQQAAASGSADSAWFVAMTPAAAPELSP
jgi:hypothetical protein